MWKPRRKVILISTIATGAAVICLVKDWANGPRYNKDNRIDGQVVVITGANTGIGKETARELAKRGAKVYMACRNMKKCEEARKEIVLESDNKYVYCRPCDLASMKSIREFAERFNKEEDRLDTLINNAGVMKCPHSKTLDGFETQLGVNHLGHFLLTSLLLAKLRVPSASRIINVSSLAHYSGRIKKDDLNSDRNYDPDDAYRQSKLANVLFTKELAKRLQGTNITVNALHPGIVDTEIIRHMGFYSSFFSKIFLKPFVWPFIKTPQMGAQTTIFAALDPDLEKLSGKYFSDSKVKEPSVLANDASLAKWLWDVSVKWTKAEYA